MRAEYDSEADVVYIDLTVADELDASDGDLGEAVYVHFRHGRAACVDVVGTDRDIESPLAAAAARHALDFPALRTATRAALAAPNQVIELTPSGEVTVIG
jgi:uncharacterized protein YuzE